MRIHRTSMTKTTPLSPALLGTDLHQHLLLSTATRYQIVEFTEYGSEPGCSGGSYPTVGGQMGIKSGSDSPGWAVVPWPIGIQSSRSRMPPLKASPTSRVSKAVPRELSCIAGFEGSEDDNDLGLHCEMWLTSITFEAHT
jgi:hypothetical protein